ncbi:integrin beta-1-like [Cheilinus undulatus]|uniref:integrin beta-1-like n=1 Tax=Cheilinus undulatus TaxID=241271 RepID=UPI001BD1EEB9|nr:integrin beta-1-like [Cheilinus undulatus]
MSVKLLCFSLLVAVFCVSWAKEQNCLKSASNCEECLQSGPDCAWCTEPQSNVRCHTSKGLRRAGCQKSNIYNPKGRVEIIRNDSNTEPENTKTLFLQPQKLSLSLRPGVSQSFPLTITMPTDQPITELAMDTLPHLSGVNITFSSSVNRNPAVIQVNVEADWCPHEGDDSNQRQNLTGPWSVLITPRGFSLGLELEITLECQCECTSNSEENSSSCAGHGTLVCGQCECSEPYIGPQCQTVSFFPSNEDFCRSGLGAPVCSGRGKCVEGFCECDKRVNPAETYSGRFCECSNFDCLRHNGRLCGGHGRCMCGRCICDNDWTGEECSCSMDMASCMATNQRVCNDRGICECGACRCDNPYMGPTCEDCPTCPGRCERNADCVECLAFRTGSKKDRCDQDCSHLTVTVMETKLPSAPTREILCKMHSRDDFCTFFYTLPEMPSRGEQATVWAKNCPSV